MLLNCLISFPLLLWWHKSLKIWETPIWNECEIQKLIHFFRSCHAKSEMVFRCCVLKLSKVFQTIPHILLYSFYLFIYISTGFPTNCFKDQTQVFPTYYLLKSCLHLHCFPSPNPPNIPHLLSQATPHPVPFSHDVTTTMQRPRPFW